MLFCYFICDVSIDTIRRVWRKLRRDEPELVGEFEDFLSRTSGEMKRTQTDFRSLEHALKKLVLTPPSYKKPPFPSPYCLHFEKVPNQIAEGCNSFVNEHSLTYDMLSFTSWLQHNYVVSLNVARA